MMIPSLPGFLNAEGSQSRRLISWQHHEGVNVSIKSQMLQNIALVDRSCRSCILLFDSRCTNGQDSYWEYAVAKLLVATRRWCLILSIQRPKLRRIAESVGGRRAQTTNSRRMSSRETPFMVIIAYAQEGELSRSTAVRPSHEMTRERL